MSLSRRLRDGTRQAHVQAERSAFMGRVLKGTVSRAGYADMLESLLEIYRALEGGLEEAADPVRALHPPALHRTEALERDLAVFRDGGLPGGEPGTGPPAGERPAAAGALAERIRAVSGVSGASGGLLSHAYVRYLGDLSGGRVLGRLVRKRFGLEGEEGVAFYAFPELDDPDGFKVRYREGLDALPLAEEEQEAVVDEARRSFAMHQALFRELEEREAAREG